MNSLSNVSVEGALGVGEGALGVDYELRIVVEKVSVSSQEVVKRDTLKVYDVKAPESILGSVTDHCAEHIFVMPW